ncbi:MAG: hypothetical protein HW416_1935 [Chloroflexi bacterium]|nr:hypothetical protein [Chloroflexota bacterium]
MRTRFPLGLPWAERPQVEGGEDYPAGIAMPALGLQYDPTAVVERDAESIGYPTPENSFITDGDNCHCERRECSDVQSASIHWSQDRRSVGQNPATVAGRRSVGDQVWCDRQMTIEARINERLDVPAERADFEVNRDVGETSANKALAHLHLPTAGPPTL